MPRKDQGWITFQASQEELELLEELCRKSQSTKTEILRELVRGLNNYYPNLKQSKSIRKQPRKYTHNSFGKNLELNSNNIVKGVITKIVRTELNTEVIFKVSNTLQLISVITNASADELGLDEGIEAYAVINSNNIVITKTESINGGKLEVNTMLVRENSKQAAVLETSHPQIINR
ncbi:TOBE domain-containing protein [Nostoc spongiaeforme FACHB-130]|uniref:TOBE domain-containing protein n=1 Tax=Nostoc spongiaeforme FACHB-130 TaxID=1357510 RepID=A0ABR8FRH2_9NOSO|nr:TOBE domain-containing protein [Nostoc spongiaeforme]MBD2593555.1 TOBE domain-containing protein [Nostoc spongiaeforme FACHB-130]